LGFFYFKKRRVINKEKWLFECLVFNPNKIRCHLYLFDSNFRLLRENTNVKTFWYICKKNIYRLFDGSIRRSERIKRQLLCKIDFQLLKKISNKF